MGSHNHDFLTIGDGAAGSIKRGRARDSLFLVATLQFGDEAATHDARIRNLSEGGMMAELARVVPSGTPVRITVRGIGEVPGRVAWCAAGRAGISFDIPIDPKRARKPVGTSAKSAVAAKSFAR